MKSPFVLERPGLAAAYIYMLIEGVVFYVLTLLIEVLCEVLVSWLPIKMNFSAVTEKVFLPKVQIPRCYEQTQVCSRL